MSSQQKKKIRVSVVGGVQLLAGRVGNFYGFLQVYASKKTKANVFSFAEVEDKYDITYIRGRSFMVNMPTPDTVLERKKSCVAEWCAEDSTLDTAANATVQETGSGCIQRRRYVGQSLLMRFT
jgi:hypothetical protein